MLIALIIIGVKPRFFTESKSTKLGFEDIGELATQSAFCTEVNVTDKPRTLFGFAIPFTQTKYVYSYDYNIKAGIDFTQVKWKVDEDSKIIEVEIPEVYILSSEILSDSFKVYHEKESVFTNVSLEENNKALEDMKETAQKDSINNGLFTEARLNAEEVLKGFISKVYDEYKIKFVDK